MQVRAHGTKPRLHHNVLHHLSFIFSSRRRRFRGERRGCRRDREVEAGTDRRRRRRRRSMDARLAMPNHPFKLFEILKGACTAPNPSILHISRSHRHWPDPLALPEPRVCQQLYLQARNVLSRPFFNPRNRLETDFELSFGCSSFLKDRGFTTFNARLEALHAHWKCPEVLARLSRSEHGREEG